MNIGELIRDFDKKDLLSHIILIGENGSVRNIEVENEEIEWELKDDANSEVDE